VRAQATFRLVGPAPLTARDVTARTGVEPDEAHEIGDPVGRSVSGRVHEQAFWALHHPATPTDGVEVGDAIRAVLDRLEPAADVLHALVAEGWWANWFCYVGSAACEHAVEIDRDLMHRLLAIPGELWLDVYPDDEE
jgi:hypothetical protein